MSEAGEQPPFVLQQYREDEWPRCPECGADEVWSNIWNSGPRPSFEEFMAGPLSCYACGWRKP